MNDKHTERVLQSKARKTASELLDIREETVRRCGELIARYRRGEISIDELKSAYRDELRKLCRTTIAKGLEGFIALAIEKAVSDKAREN